MEYRNGYINSFNYRTDYRKNHNNIKSKEFNQKIRNQVNKEDFNVSQDYIKGNTNVHLLNYHIVFCPRYRRKIFNIPGVEDRFKALVKEKCDEMGILIISMDCDVDHTHLFLRMFPTNSPQIVIKHIKGYTSKKLREEFKELELMPTVWTRSYFISTAGRVSSDIIKTYVENQKKNSRK